MPSKAIGGKRKAKPKARSLTRKADKLCGGLVRSRGVCEAKGLDHLECSGPLQWAHIVTRSNYRLRWEEYNALCLCLAHHMFYTHHSWDWQEFIRDHFPVSYGLIAQHRNEPWDRDTAGAIARLEGK